MNPEQALKGKEIKIFLDPEGKVVTASIPSGHAMVHSTAGGKTIQEAVDNLVETIFNSGIPISPIPLSKEEAIKKFSADLQSLDEIRRHPCLNFSDPLVDGKYSELVVSVPWSKYPLSIVAFSEEEGFGTTKIFPTDVTYPSFVTRVAKTVEQELLNEGARLLAQQMIKEEIANALRAHIATMNLRPVPWYMLFSKLQLPVTTGMGTPMARLMNDDLLIERIQGAIQDILEKMLEVASES